jgi:antibiotic biosynthesis monooxygenase (ABM) superfamily enzyme
MFTDERTAALTQSLIDLQRQAVAIQQAIDEGTQRWAGENPRKALITTLKAMLYDAGKMQDINGADKWSEEKRQFAIDRLMDVSHPNHRGR